MTAHTTQPGVRAARRRRPRWLLPVLVAAVLAIALVIGGVLPASLVLFAISMGGMLLMHAGGHGGHGSGHAAHDAGAGEEGDAEASEGGRGGGCH